MFGLECSSRSRRQMNFYVKELLSLFSKWGRGNLRGWITKTIWNQSKNFYVGDAKFGKISRKSERLVRSCLSLQVQVCSSMCGLRTHCSRIKAVEHFVFCVALIRQNAKENACWERTICDICVFELAVFGDLRAGSSLDYTAGTGKHQATPYLRHGYVPPHPTPGAGWYSCRNYFGLCLPGTWPGPTPLPSPSWMKAANTRG